MKLVVISDTHIGSKNSIGVWEQALEEAYKLANEDGVLIHSGDWFDDGINTPPTLSNRVIQTLCSLSLKYPKVILYSILGNHDLSLLNNIKAENPNIYSASPLFYAETIVNSTTGKTSMKHFNSYGFVPISSKSSTINLHFQGFLPPKLLQEKLGELIESLKPKKNGTIDILVCHTSFNGQKLPSGKTEENGCDLNSLSFFDCIISGHIHKPSQSKNVVVAGAPYQLRFGDTDGVITIITV